MIAEKDDRSHGLLSEDHCLKNPPKTKSTVVKWFEDYKKTNYPGRPITRQFLEMIEIAKSMKIDLKQMEVPNA
jgi:hypothetical protein